MRLFNSQSTDLRRIADALELLVAHITRGNGNPTSLRTIENDYKEDGSGVTYVDDVQQFIEETRRLDYFEKTGVRLGDAEKVPSPLNDKGKEWGKE